MNRLIIYMMFNNHNEENLIRENKYLFEPMSQKTEPTINAHIVVNNNLTAL